MDRREPLAGLIVCKLRLWVKGALEGSSGVFRKGHRYLLTPSSVRKVQSNQTYGGASGFLIRRGIRARSIGVRPQDSNVQEEVTKTTLRLVA